MDTTTKTRAERLAALLAETDQDDGQQDDGHRWALIEQSTHDGHTYLTLHPSPGLASDYWSTQECPQDWEPMRLVDLDTGAEWLPTVTFIVDFEPMPEELQRLRAFA